MTELRRWAKERVSEATELTESEYLRYLEDFKNPEIDIKLLRKSIFQNHKNPTDEAMRIALEKYYKDSQNDSLINIKMRVVLYELKEQSPDKFNKFVQMIELY